jgi:hypothetical protein
MPTDCSACRLKPICDEVEGMKELHFGQKKESIRTKRRPEKGGVFA